MSNAEETIEKLRAGIEGIRDPLKDAIIAMYEYVIEGSKGAIQRQEGKSGTTGNTVLQATEATLLESFQRQVNDLISPRQGITPETAARSLLENYDKGVYDKIKAFPMVSGFMQNYTIDLEALAGTRAQNVQATKKKWFGLGT